MDYTKASLIFRIRKAFRYIQLYGPMRTWCKVQGQYHMKKVYTILPKIRKRNAASRIGIIGCGNFAYSNISYYLKKNYGSIISGCMDIDINKAASLYEKYNLNYYTDNADKIINDPQIDLIYIASNHSTHAEYAIRALESGKNVHIEKPHVVNNDQLERLCSAMIQSAGKVSLGFNRPGSRIGQLIQDALNREVGASMLSWFIAGHEIAQDHWYFRDEEGGRVLGNLCHWTDFVYHLVPRQSRFPITITPTRAERSDCDIAVTYIFGDGSIAAITFSAKGHTFEGVRERFAAHKGNTLIAMDDFKTVTIERGYQKRHIKLFFRDHGHERAVKASYELLRDGENGCSVEYVWETGQLFLNTKQALEENRIIIVNSYNEYLNIRNKYHLQS